MKFMHNCVSQLGMLAYARQLYARLAGINRQPLIMEALSHRCEARAKSYVKPVKDVTRASSAYITIEMLKFLGSR